MQNENEKTIVCTCTVKHVLNGHLELTVTWCKYKGSPQ